MSKNRLIIKLMISFIVFSAISCKGNKSTFKIDSILQEYADEVSGESTEVGINTLIKKLPSSTKKTLDIFDTNDIHMIVSGGFKVMSTYCSLTEMKHVSDNSAYEQTRKLYEETILDTVDTPESGFSDSQVKALTKYNETALDAATTICTSA